MTFPRLDHVIIATPNAARSAARLKAEHGIDAVPGGAHPWGTANWLARLGDAYLELLEVNDPLLAANDPMGAFVLQRAREHDVLMGWAIEVADIEKAAERLSLELEAGERTRPDGSTLAWTMAGRGVACSGALPFLIAWSDPATRPSRSLPAGGPEISSVSVHVGCTESELAAWSGGSLRAVCSGDSRALDAVVVETPNGLLTL